MPLDIPPPIQTIIFFSPLLGPSVLSKKRLLAMSGMSTNIIDFFRNSTAIHVVIYHGTHHRHCDF